MLPSLISCSFNVAAGPTFTPVAHHGDQGVIYVYLMQGVLGWDHGWRISVNNSFAGTLHNHGYLPVIVEHGPVTVSFTDHTPTVEDYNRGWAVEVFVQKGEEVFIRLTNIEIPNPLHRTNTYRLCVVDKATGLSEIRHLRLSQGVMSSWSEDTYPEFYKRLADCSEPYL